MNQKAYSKNTEITTFNRLIEAYQKRSLNDFEMILKENNTSMDDQIIQTYLPLVIDHLKNKSS